MKKNNLILVTGAGKGIGYATVIELCKKNYDVYAIIKNKKDNRKFKKIQNLKIFNGDVRNNTFCKNIFNFAKSEKKIITGLVNNAGVRKRKDFLKLNKKEMSDVFDINFFSILNLMQIFSKEIIKKKARGSIVNIASIVGQIGFNQLSLYASSKGALISLTKSFATEMAKRNIRANIISPGFIKTSYYNKFKKKKKLYKWTLNRIPLKRWGEPGEVSKLIEFLISDNSRYINGENLNIDGGWLSS